MGFWSCLAEILTNGVVYKTVKAFWIIRAGAAELHLGGAELCHELFLRCDHGNCRRTARRHSFTFS